MRIVCPHCETAYQIADERLPRETSAFAGCPACGGRIEIAPVDPPDLLTGTPSDAPVIFPKRESRPRAAPPPDPPGRGPRFQVSASLGFGWRALKAHTGLLVAGALVLFMIEFVPQAIGGLMDETRPILAGFIYLAGWLLSQFASLGLLAVALKVCDGRIAGLGDMFRQGARFLPFVAGSILYAMLCAVGLVLFVVPGIYWALTYMFYGFYILDASAGPLEAMKKSAKLTRGAKWRLLGLWMGLILLNLAGLIPFGLGLLITVPVSLVALANVFRRLQGRSPDPAW